MSFWTKLKGTIAVITTLVEAGLFIAESDHLYKVLTLGIGAVATLISIYIEDKNNNGIVDAFEKNVDPDEKP